MKLLLSLLIVVAAAAQPTKPNLVDIKPPAIAPPGTTYAVVLSPGFGVIAIPDSFIDRSTNPPTLKLPAPTSTVNGQLWDDSFMFSGSQSFTTLSAPLGRVYVYKNGVQMTVTRDYTATLASGLTTVTFVAAQPVGSGDSVTLQYMK